MMVERTALRQLAAFWVALALVMCVFPAAAVLAQNKQKVSQDEIDKAIENGVKFLSAKYSDGLDPGKQNEAELVALTLIHGGAPRDKGLLPAIIEKMLKSPLQRTYNVALTSIALATLDPVKYQERIAACAKWLVDAQCRNGMWTYNGAPDPVTATGDEDDTETESGTAGSPGGRRTIDVSRGNRANAPPSGDGSNTQFAVLGLYAALVANVHAPKETWQDALKWYESTLRMQGTYAGGWTYTGSDVRASMTCAGAASVRMCDLGLGKADASKRLLDAGKNWLAWKYEQILSSKESRGGFGYFYNMYALERACILNGWVKLGDDDWYQDGAKWLVDNQAGTGGWNEDDPIDTCFAILFLKRAVISVSGSVVVTPDDPEEEPKQAETPDGVK